MEDNKVIKVMYFDNDDEFHKFCVKPSMVVKSYVAPSGETQKYYDIDLTQDYYDALADGVRFVIRDKNSKIIRRNNTVSQHTCCKKVQNLYHAGYEKFFNLDPNVEVLYPKPIVTNVDVEDL